MVKVKVLARYIEEQKISAIDLIKIDVETFEYEVLSGYGKYFLAHQPIIVLEIQDRTIGKNIESLISNSSYEYYNIDEEKGLHKVNELGTSKHNNYVLCPGSKSALIKNFIITN